MFLDVFLILLFIGFTCSFLLCLYRFFIHLNKQAFAYYLRRRHGDFMLLAEAVATNDLKTTQCLLGNGVDVNGRNQIGRTVLHYFPWLCKGKRRYDILKTLMDHGASLSILDKRGHFAYEYLFTGERKKAIQILMQYDLDLLVRDGEDMTPLHYLVCNENKHVFQLIKGRTFDINARSETGDTPLILAAYSGNVNAVEFLLKQGADANLANNFGQVPLYASFWVSSDKIKAIHHHKIISLLLQYGAQAQHINFAQFQDHPLHQRGYFLLTIVAHLAMIEIQGQLLSSMARSQINFTYIYRYYFARCQRQLVRLHKITVLDAVTLYELLIESPSKIVYYAYEPRFASAFKKAVRRVNRHIDPYYYYALRRRVGRALQLARLQLRAAPVVQQLTGFHVYCHRLIVLKILNYLNDQDLKKLDLQREQDLHSSLDSLFSAEN